MAGERDMADETRNQMMQNLFGEQSEDEEEEEEVNSVHEAAANHSDYESQVESEGERFQSSPERGISYEKMESEPKDGESEEEGYGQRVTTSRRREVMASESEESEDNRYADHEDEEIDSDQPRKSRSMDEQKDEEVVRDVFGDSDEDEQAEYGGQDEIEHDSHRSPAEEETNYEQDLKPEDIVPDEDMQYGTEDENFDDKPKEKPVGPPLVLDVPLQLPPSRPDRMNVIKVSNIMGIEPKPFDPKTYVEEDVFVTDESGVKKRIRLEDNIVRWRMVKNRDGTVSYESNARFVRWKDGSLQLLIGNEVLDISVNDAHHDQSHLFLRRGKVVGQTIRANALLHRKREKVNRKYAQPAHRGRQLSPGFLEDALDEEDEAEDYYSSHRGSARSRFEEDLEAEARAEKRIINAKKSNLHTNKPSLSAARSSKRPLEEYSESEKEESEYESEGEEIERSPMGAREDEQENEDEYEEEVDEEAADAISPSEEEEEPRKKIKETGRSNLKRKEIESDEESPPRKTVHRRKAVVYDSDED
ncbi:hypothetical protein ZIOFF_003600 [Zingiber officinale]|uniref:Protein LEO1 homolog n=1 Tax=Zingiber officinale TaxID=94328 RepID=A0A8J5HYQ7_ZINOF|nr:hypothetical protein ZIOFF_003600 [Zingiber officinale]